MVSLLHTSLLFVALLRAALAGARLPAICPLRLFAMRPGKEARAAVVMARAARVFHSRGARGSVERRRGIERAGPGCCYTLTSICWRFLKIYIIPATHMQ
eukprot:6184400-Pleurochrysis_carterae.AAC.3